jgi:hypothetical protein
MYIKRKKKSERQKETNPNVTVVEEPDEVGTASKASHASRLGSKVGFEKDMVQECKN